ncbi:MAG: AbrB/MazE/SpoVT family DNA-binding domain-containing protein [Candidatus Thermoplasmatota archaeon]|jgi:phosphate uptake regulator|nr:AbrB/MazE/SpoVT family DNA-binding domain-containing protein [Candidatus Thermoplasmatota archaeon]
MKDVRKLQITANGTYIVTIPKAWVDSLGLTKGDPLSLSLQGNEISITPVLRKQQSIESRSISVEDFTDARLLEMCITSSYVVGNDIMEVKSGKESGHEWKSWVRESLDGLLGVEISEEYSTRIMLQNLIDPYKFDLVGELSKFMNNSMAVLLDSIHASGDLREDLASDAFRRGKELIKSYRFLMRLASLASRSIELREKYGFKTIQKLMISVIAIREMGRISYYSMRTAQHVTEIGNVLSPEFTGLLESMASHTVEMSLKAFDSLKGNDIKKASEVLEMMKKVRKIFAQIHEMENDLPAQDRLPMTLIIRGIRAIAGYAVALADDSVLNIYA